MTSFNVMFKMFEPYFRPETKKAHSPYKKTAGSREQKCFCNPFMKLKQ